MQSQKDPGDHLRQLPAHCAEKSTLRPDEVCNGRCTFVLLNSRISAIALEWQFKRIAKGVLT